MICALGCFFNGLIACLVGSSIYSKTNAFRCYSSISVALKCSFAVSCFDLTAPPQLIEKPQDVQKTIDETLLWECKANAKPKPSYRWLKNGEPLDPMEVRDL